MIMSSAQCRSARALLGWSEAALAEASNLSQAEIAAFEAAHLELERPVLEALVAAFETAGVALVEENGGGAGVRFRRSSRPPEEGLRPEDLDATNDD